MFKVKNKKNIFSSIFSSLVVLWFHLRFELIIVSLMFLLVVFKKYFPHRSHVYLLICNFVHQLARIFHGHPLKVSLNKRLIHSVSHVQAQLHDPHKSMICVHRSERFSSSSTRHSLLILEISQKYINLIESYLP